MIDRITCLCLDKRKELWQQLDCQVNKLFNQKLDKFICGDGSDADLSYNHIDVATPNIQFLYVLNKGHYNAFLCHKKIAQQAVNDKLNNFLLLEDDAYIIEDRVSLLYSDKVKQVVNSDQWDIIYFGWWLKLKPDSSEDREDLELRWKENREFNLEIVPRPPQVAHEICGLHGVLINKSLFEFIANAPTGPIDSILHRNFHKIKAWFLWPKLIHTHSTFSYCENSMCYRNKI